MARRPFLCALTVALGLGFAPQALSAPDLCSRYASLKSPRRAGALALYVLSAQQGKIRVAYLGTPRQLRVTVNGIDLRPYFAGEKELICHGERAGAIRTYDVTGLSLDAGYVELSSGTLKNGASVTLR